MKKIILILIFSVSALFGYFESDFLEFSREVSPPYFYGSFNYGGDLEVMQDYLNYLKQALTGDIDILSFHKPRSLMYGFMKFKARSVGAEFTIYDSLIKLKNSTEATERKQETTVLAVQMYQNNRFYNNGWLGFSVTPYSRTLYYVEDDHNIFTSDIKRTNEYVGVQMSPGGRYHFLSYFDFKFQIGPRMEYFIQGQKSSIDIIGTIALKYTSQIYLFRPIWFHIHGYYKKNYFEDNFGFDVYMKPNKFLNMIMGSSEHRMYVSMKMSPFSFVNFQFSSDYEYDNERLSLMLGMTLYYDGLGMPTFR